MRNEKSDAATRKWWRGLAIIATSIFMASGVHADSDSDSDSDSDNGHPPRGTIVDIAADNGNFTLLVATLQATGLDAALADTDARYTVFAPTDAAFNALGADTIDDLLANPDVLSNILLYHLLDKKKTERKLRRKAGKSLQTLNGQDVDISILSGDLYINDARVEVADIRASNGIIHVIDTVLIPPPPPAPLANIVDTAVTAGDFTTLVAALEATGLDQVLADESGEFTVFAPTDDAFDALGADTIAALLADTATLSDILLFHVVDGVNPASRILRRNGKAIRTLNGDPVAVNLTTEGLYINQSLVTVTDIAASNGVIHVIERVLLPVTDEVVDGTIVDVAVGAGNFMTLVAALQATGLDRVLSIPWLNFTVLAPTDDAFAALGMDTINDLLADPATLSNILLYHVAFGDRDSTAVLKRVKRDLRMLNRDRVDVAISGGDIFVNDAKIIIQDIRTNNGTIHVIDAVLIPPTRLHNTDRSLLQSRQ